MDDITLTEDIMDRIASLKQYRCGTEDFDFSQLYLSCDIGIKTLPINVLMLEHRRQGLILINTGCSLRLRQNQSDYARLTASRKLDFTEKDTIKSRLKADGLDPLAVKKVLLTHCDPECCGGLYALPKYIMYSTARVLATFTIADPSDRIMKSTIPEEDITKKAAGLYKGKCLLNDYFKWVFDVFGDGSLLAVDINGHSGAMAGYFIPEMNIFFAADASVDETAVYEDLVPSDKLLSLQSDPDGYLLVLMLLKRMHREHPEIKMYFSHSESIS